MQTKREALQERVKTLLEKTTIDRSHYDFYLETLTEEAVENQDHLTDEIILAHIASKELFWGLGDALNNYVQWEKEQI